MGEAYDGGAGGRFAVVVPRLRRGASEYGALADQVRGRAEGLRSAFAAAAAAAGDPGVAGSASVSAEVFPEGAAAVAAAAEGVAGRLRATAENYDAADAGSRQAVVRAAGGGLAL